VIFTNSGSTGLDSYAALTPNFPTAKVVPVVLSDPNVGGRLICQQGAYMASYGDASVQVDCDWTMVQKVLKPGETILVDTFCLLAYADTCKMDLRRAGGILGMVGGGEGIFNTTVTGPGLVIVQSMNETVFLQALAAQKLYRR
jgi:uncharacterized protein (AIM24 family)